MSDALPAAVLAQLGDFLATYTGLHFPPDRWPDLQRGLSSAAREFGFTEPEACAHWLLSGPPTQRQLEILAADLTVGETYFFRERNTFAALEQQILPDLIAARRGNSKRLRIWSAGCCTGEEPYSLAIALSRLLPDLGDWDVTLLATDINPRFLKTASEGVYGEWSFRDVPAGVKEKYFSRTKQGRYQIRPELQRMVRFDYLNLADAQFPSILNSTNAMDLILCRNVLIYMEAGGIGRIIDKFQRSLAEGGWLLVGASETSHVFSAGLSAVSFPGLTAYRRTNPVATPAIAPVASVIACVLPKRAIRFERRVEPPATQPSQEAAAELYDRGDYDGAIRAAMAKVQADDVRGPAMTLLARCHANQGDLAAALHWSRQAITADKLNPPLHYLFGTIQQEMGDAPGAAVSFARALYLDPDFVMAHVALGHLARRRGIGDAAERHFENALRLLRKRLAEESVAESEGLTVGRLAEIISTLNAKTLTGNEV